MNSQGLRARKSAATSASRAVRTTRTRPALCGALLSLLEEKSFEQITVREITERAEVGYATFFRRYADKEAVLNDLAELEIRKLLALTLPILYTVDSRASAQAVCAYVWEHRKLWSALLTGGAAAAVKQELIRQASDLATEREAERQWPPSDLIVVSAVAATVEILAWWLKQKRPPPVKEMAEIFNQLVIVPSISKSNGRRL